MVLNISGSAQREGRAATPGPQLSEELGKTHHGAPTAGSAKKEMAKTEKQEAMVFPTHVWGTLSP